MNGDDPGKFLTSTVTSSAGAVAKGMGRSALGSGFEGAWLGASIGSMVPGIGTIAGGAVGAGLGAAFGSLTGASKTLTGVWDKLIDVTKSLVGTFAKFDPLLSMQQERWRRLDVQIGKVWAKTLAPTLKHLTDIGIEIKQRWTRLKVEAFKGWEGIVNRLISVLGALARAMLSILEFLEKLKSLIVDLVKLFTPLIESVKLLWEGFKGLLEWLGLFTPQKKGGMDGAPDWEPGGVPGYGKSSAGGIGGGTPLLHGKFAPDMGTPEWAKRGKFEFTWVKDFKGWLGGYLDKILIALGIPKRFLGEAKEVVSTAVGAARAVGGSITPSAVKVPFLGKFVAALNTFLLAFKIGTSIGASQRERKLGQPITEEDKEKHRREHNLPKKEKSKPTSFLGGAILPGRAGMAQRVVGMSAFAATPPEPKVRTPKKERRAEAETEAEAEVKRSGQELDRLMKRWEKSGKAELPPGLQKAAKRYDEASTTLDKIVEGEKEALPTTEPRTKERHPRERHPRRPETPEDTETPKEGEEETPTVAEPEELTQRPVEEPTGNIVMQVLDSNQLLDMLAFSWDEIRTVLRHQQAEYTLLKYRMQTEGTYL